MKEGIKISYRIT